MADMNLVYAGAWRRLAASLIDTVLFVAFYYALTFLIKDVLVSGIVYQIGCAAYFIGMESSSRQASLGKQVMGIYVANIAGARPLPSAIILRYALYFLPFLPSLFVMLSPSYIAHSVALQELTDPKEINAFMARPENIEMMMKFGIVFIGGILAYIVFYLLPIIFTKQKTGLHDAMSKTRVLKRQIQVTAQVTEGK